MSSADETEAEGKWWWKDLNILIGIGGVLATIIVGVLTYWLTTDSVSREYQERVKAARNDVLAVVARSLGEGVIPNKEKILCVLSSIRRQYNIKIQDFESPETVIDDILARVLANEFLDAKRREELSTQLLAAKAEEITINDQLKANDTKPNHIDSSRLYIALLSVLSSFVAAIFIMFIQYSILKIISIHSRFIISSLIGIIILLIGVIVALKLSHVKGDINLIIGRLVNPY